MGDSEAQRRVTHERWSQVKEVLLAVLELDPAERSAFLSRACGEDQALREEVASLLEQEGRLGERFEPPASGRISAAGELLPAGYRIGPYRIRRRVRRGGMGTVYEAAEDNDGLRVAVKVINRGMDTEEVVRRFQKEQQILAGLDHPNIAKLIDAGSTPDGRGYFVMEYVEGKPIDQYCDGLGLGLGERLELFREVCEAVQFSHRHLVVHRDLKPGNVLVTAEGTVKLLDFGIAKILHREPSATASLTAPGRLPMTPAYASPEQVRGEAVSTLSDVYSLGVLLYRLLAGCHPYVIAPGAEAERVICDEDPPKPSVAARGSVVPRPYRRLAGDLDCIVLRAMRKEPGRRYVSAEQLSEDVRAYLEGRPVMARRGTHAYRAGKFVRRHKMGLMAAAACVLALLGMSAVMTYMWLASEEQRRRAIRISEAHGTSLSLFGKDHRQLGNYDKALRLLAESLELRRQLYPRDHPVLARAVNDMAALFYDVDRLDEAEGLFREALGMKRRLFGDDATETLATQNNLASLLCLRGELDQAEALYRKSLSVRVKELGREHEKVAQSLNQLGTLLYTRGEHARAEPLLREALEIRRRLYEPGHRALATSLNNLAMVVQARGDPARAEPLYRSALEIGDRLGGGHPMAAVIRRNLASLLTTAWKGRPEECEPPATQALADLRRLLPEGHWQIASAESVLGGCLAAQGRYREAEPLLISGYRTLRNVRGEQAVYTRDAHRRLAEFRAVRSRPGEIISRSGS